MAETLSPDESDGATPADVSRMDQEFTAMREFNAQVIRDWQAMKAAGMSDDTAHSFLKPCIENYWFHGMVKADDDDE